MGKTLTLLGLGALLAGCHHAPPIARDGSTCRNLELDMNPAHPLEFLDDVTDEFYKGCHDVVLRSAAKARERFGQKTYSLSRETTNIFLPDGKVTDYTLESYERGFLTVLLADSYLRKGKLEDAKVELRRLDEELFVREYNYGEDPANLALSAVLWERAGEPGEARVDWLRLRDEAGALKGLEAEIRSFADRQVARIDREEPLRAPWRVYGSGRFPDAVWNVNLAGSSANYYRVKPTVDFRPACASETGVRIPTRRWFDKLAHRYDASYHPLQNAQSWLRLSVGTLYGVVPVLAGAGVAGGGCALGFIASTKNAAASGADICEDSLQSAGRLMRTAPKIWRGVLAPDFRHWGYIPSAFVVTTAASLRDEPCSRGLPADELAQAGEF